MQFFKVQLQPKLPIASSTKTQMFSKIKPEDRLITRRASGRPFDAPLKPKVPKSRPPTLESLSAKRASDLVHDNAVLYHLLADQRPIPVRILGKKPFGAELLQAVFRC